MLFFFPHNYPPFFIHSCFSQSPPFVMLILSLIFVFCICYFCPTLWDGSRVDPLFLYPCYTISTDNDYIWLIGCFLSSPRPIYMRSVRWHFNVTQLSITSRDSLLNAGWATGVRFSSGADIFLVVMASKMPLMTIQPLIRWVPVVIS
jgi:hypothetical protein